jgi:formylglycine-generating enzyme required for sulfatase activity
MSGTWTSTLYQPYPYIADHQHENVDNADDPRVLRGGSWGYNRDDCRCAYRRYDDPGDRLNNIGFRVCVGPHIDLAPRALCCHAEPGV